MSYNSAKNGNFPHRTIPFRWSLFGGFALLVAFISAATLTVSFIETARLINDLSNSLIARTQRQTETELQRLFAPITNQVAVAHQWVRNGLVKRYDTEALMALLLPGMFELPQCVSMMVSDMHGYEFTIFRNESGGQLDTPEERVQWTTRDFRREAWGKTALWTLWDENGANILKQWSQDAVWDKTVVAQFSPSGTGQSTMTGEDDLIYDPRPRFWHQGARDRYRIWTAAEIFQNPQKAIYWTNIDMFFTSKAPGITASIAVKDPHGKLVVVAYDLLLRDLSVFTQSLQPTEHGKTFVFTDTGKIIGLPRDERFQNEEMLADTILQPLEAIGIPEVTSFIEGWRARQSDEASLFRFKSQGQVWWAGFCPFHVNTDRMLWIGVIIPESDLLRTARQNRMIILGIGIAALVLAMLLAWVVSQNLTRPLKALVQQSDRIATLELSPGSPVQSRLTEIGELSHALDIVRTSLQHHIAQQKEAEAALRESEARYRNMFANNHAVMLLIDPETAEIIDANPAACAFYGYTHAELTRCKITTINTLSRAEVFAEMQRAKSEQRRYFLFRHRLASGEIRDVEVYSGPIQVHARSLLYSIIHDVTDRHRAEEALRASEAKYRMLFEEALTPIMIVDETGSYLDANAAALEFLECRREELMQKKVWDFSPPDVIEQQQAEHAPFVGRRTLETDYDVHGQIKTLLLNIVPLTLSGQTILYGIGQDITDRKRAEEEIQRINTELEERVRQRTAELEATNRDLQDFIRLSTHDLKTPLLGISQLASWLSSDYADRFDPEGRQWVGLLIKRVTRMDRLLNGMVAYSQIGRTFSVYEQVDLNALVQHVLAAIDPPEHIRVVVKDDFPCIMSTPKHLYSVFYHLLQNAVTFLEKPEGLVTVGYADEGKYWAFRISDTGPGIAAKYHKKIFQIFQTLEPKDRRENPGIGLALVKKTVELHGGRVWVESTPGQGSTFFFTWPKKEEAYDYTTPIWERGSPAHSQTTTV